MEDGIERFSSILLERLILEKKKKELASKTEVVEIITKPTNLPQ